MSKRRAAAKWGAVTKAVQREIAAINSRRPMITNLERAQLNCQRLRQLPRDSGIVYANAQELEEITELVEEAISALVNEIKSIRRRLDQWAN